MSSFSRDARPGREPGPALVVGARADRRVPVGAVLYQRIIDTGSNPGPLVGGSRVDVNAVAQDCGQWNVHP